MGKYDKFSRMSYSSGRPWELHPVWRGIGCFLILLIPVLAYAGATLLVEANLEQGWVPFSEALVQTVNVPVFGPVDHLYANLLAAAFLALFGYALLVVVYSLVFRVVGYGPPKPGPLDAPPRSGRR